MTDKKKTIDLGLDRIRDSAPVNLARSGGEAVGSLVQGRDRYFRALRTLATIGRLYGQRRVPLLSWLNDRRLSDTHAKAARLIANLCRANGAVWIKAAQFFSVRPDILPPEYILELQKLQTDAGAVSFAELEPALLAAWGEDWRSSYFREFDETPVATASIAQVHRGVLTDGTEVAVKIRLPNVEQLFEQDARIFRFLATVASPLFKELDFQQITDQLLDMTSMELDFRNEAENLRRFARIQHPPRIKIPELVGILSSSNILVTEWQPGYRLRDYLDRHPEQAADLLTLLLGSYLQQVTRVGLYQADPHPGNFIVNDKGEISILDFGTIGRLEAQEVKNYSRLIYGLMGFEPNADIGQLFVDAGFEGGNPDTLRELAMYVLSDRLSNNDFGQAMADLLEKFRENRVKIPDSYIGIARVMITLGGFLMAYNVPFDWTPPERRILPANSPS